MTPTASRAPLLIALIAGAAIAAALYFEHVLGYAPCALCLQQRYAYYIGVPLALILAFAPTSPAVLRGGLVLLALIFAANSALGLYHAGIEWDWWEGPAACAPGAAATIGGNLLDQLAHTRVVPCDAAPWRFLGLSFAGWNMAISAGVALLALSALRRR